MVALELHQTPVSLQNSLVSYKLKGEREEKRKEGRRRGRDHSIEDPVFEAGQNLFLSDHYN